MRRGFPSQSEDRRLFFNRHLLARPSGIPSIIIILAIGGVCHGQTQDYSFPKGVARFATDSGNVASIGFDKSLSTYHWTGVLGYRLNSGPVTFGLHERFQSTLIRADRNLITDEQTLSLMARYKASSLVSPSMRISSFILSDNKSIGISSASAHGFHGGFAFMPQTSILLEPMAGIRIDNQVDARDRGPSFLLDVAVDSATFSGYRFDGLGRYQYDKLDPRAIETRNLQLHLDRYFFERTRNVLTVHYNRNRRDFYVPADATVQQTFGAVQNIETRSEDLVLVGDTLDYQVGTRALLTIQGNILDRTIHRTTRYRYIDDPRANTTIDELRIDGGMSLSLSPTDRIRTVARLLYQEREERHELDEDGALYRFKDLDSLTTLEESKNNRSRRSSVAGEMRIVFSATDTMELSGSGTILRYDTPSGRNLEDRDELWYLISANAAHRFSRSLAMSLSADVHLTHLVYLSSRRSDQNTWNRIFRLSPRLVYTPSRTFTSINRFEVLANYTAYDFEFLSSNIRSFVFRQFSLADSTFFQCTRRFGIEWTSIWRLYDRGDLKWDAFSERLINSFVDRSYGGTLHYALEEGLLFSIGIRYFSQLRYGYRGVERYLETQFRSVGPTTSIAWNSKSRTILSIHGWYEHQTQTGIASRNFANLTMSLNVRI